MLRSTELYWRYVELSSVWVSWEVELLPGRLLRRSELAERSLPTSLRKDSPILYFEGLGAVFG